MPDTPSYLWSNSACHWSWLALVVCLWQVGCATTPYRFGRFHHERDDQPKQVQVEYGRPQKTLDNIAWAMGLWSRLLPLNSHVNIHDISEKTEDKLIAYLEDNDLADVLVRVNQYDPKGEWRRLRENDRIGPGWKYTAGLLSMAHYTLLPGRVFGGDQYNAFTNTLYINSDVPAVVLHEAAYAKDIHSRSMPGSYAVFNELPLLSMWRHTKGVNDVLGYAQLNDDWNIERETYRVVYPQMGVQSTAVGGPFLHFWDGILLSVGGAVVGHATGQVAISQRTRERKELGIDDTIEAGSESRQGSSVRSQSDPPGQVQLIRFGSESEDESPGFFHISPALYLDE